MPRPGPRPLPPLLPTLWLLPFAVAAGCGGGGATSPLGGALITPEVMACRSRVDRPTQFTEIALRSAQNLGSARVVDRSGVERRARLHPDGSTVVFARERASNDPNSRELFVGSIDGSAERRLTLDTALDDEPAWSPDG
ncbi:MAG: PD40 domain-containing protein, partial [Planctomycetes bacterium]|nr:PD40 domain-containing protein [Planctomycetota bacterium]